MKKSEGWSENSHLLKAEKRIFHSLNGQDEVKTGAGKKLQAILQSKSLVNFFLSFPPNRCALPIARARIT